MATQYDNKINSKFINNPLFGFGSDSSDSSDSESESNSDSETDQKNAKALIWNERVRRTVNTMCFAPDLEESKQHTLLKQLKKGCGGFIKKKGKVRGRTYDNSGIVNKATGRNVYEPLIQVQKECKTDIRDFLILNGFDPSNIIILDF